RTRAAARPGRPRLSPYTALFRSSEPWSPRAVKKQYGPQTGPHQIRSGLTDAVVRRFLGDSHVVDVALKHTGVGNSHKFGLGAHFIHGGAAGVTHCCTQTANQLVHNVAHRALAGNTAFNTFRHQLFNAFAGVLEVTVAGALPHRTQ